MENLANCEEIKQILQKDEDERKQFLHVIETQALEGDENSQLLLGQYYMYCSSTSPEGSKGATEGVQWLCKASRQGSDQATQLLRDCLEKNLGITESNLEDISWCVQTPKLEKVARQAARSLYQQLNPLEQSHLSRDEYLTRVQALSDDKRERKLLEHAAKFKHSNEVSEDDFVNRMVKKLTSGSGGPNVSTMLSTDVEMEAYKAAPTWKKVTHYPAKTATIVMDHAVDLAGKQGMYWLKSLIPTNQIYMLLVFFFYNLLSVQLFLWFIPLFVFYITMAALMINTMQMFYARRKQSEIRDVAKMLQKFNSALDSESAESSFSWNSLTPYLSFFIALVVCVLSFAMADKRWIPCSELLFVSSFFTATCFFALSDKYDHLMILSIFFNILSTMPVFLEGMPYVPGLYHVLHLLAGTVYSVEIVPGMSLNLGFPSLAYMVVPLIFVRMAIVNSWQGTYRILIPHLVCFFWWQIAVMFYRQSTWMGLIRASVGWFTFLILLPVIGILVVLYFAFFVFHLFTLGNILKFITTVVLITVPIVFGLWAKKGFKVKGFSLEDGTKKAKIMLLLVFCVSLIPMVYFITPPERDVEGKYLTWEQYSQFCSKPQWDKTNIADAMIKCSNFHDSMVHWKGRVKKVVLAKIDNKADHFLSMLPFALADWLRCTYGEEYPECPTIENPDERALCELSTMQNKRCHMGRLNRYVHDLWVTMPVDAQFSHDVRLEASHWFTESILQLHDGEPVEFRAMLKGNLGNTWPELRLYHLEIVRDGETRQVGSKTLLPAETWSVVETIKSGFFETWNFFVAPVVVLNTDTNVRD